MASPGLSLRAERCVLGGAASRVTSARGRFSRLRRSDTARRDSLAKHSPMPGRAGVSKPRTIRLVLELSQLSHRDVVPPEQRQEFPEAHVGDATPRDFEIQSRTRAPDALDAGDP